jgi:hypothetical protein
MDLSQLQGLLSFQATPEEQQRAMQQGLLMGGLGILSANSRNPRGAGALGALGGAMPGIMAYQQQMENAPKQRLQNVQGLLQLQKLKREMDGQKMMGDWFANQGGAQAAPGALSAEQSAGGMPGPTNAAAARLPAPQMPPFEQFALAGVPAEQNKIFMEAFKLRRPDMQVANGFAYDKNTLPPGFLPGLHTSASGQTSLSMPNAQGGVNVSAPPGALDTYSAYQGANERARAQYDLVPVPQSDGTTRTMPRSQAVQNLSGPMVGQTQMPPMGGRPPAEQEALRRVYEASNSGQGLSVSVPGGPVPSSAVLGVSQSPADRERAVTVAKGQGERELGLPQANQKLAQIQNEAGAVMATVDHALKGVSGWTVGPGGAAFSRLPGSPAKDLQQTLETIKANLGFQKIQAMRDASPTGGALGQVAVQELEMLQKAIASLDNTQSPGQLRQNLEAVKQHFSNWKQITERAYAETYPQSTQTPQRRATDGWSIKRVE